MNAILFYVVPTFRLTGSTINAIEYFLAAYEYNKEVKLILINGNRSFIDKINRIINERYLLDDIENYMNNIICLRKSELPKQEFDTVLVLDYMTLGETRGVINPKKILVISEKYTDTIFYDKSLYNVEYFGEMPFHYKDYEYRMKCLFIRYKPLKDVKKGTYVNSPRNNNFDFLYTLDLPYLPEPFIIKSKTEPERNLFEQFTNYLYFHANKWFDPHPRLFLECRFYGKCITYINPMNLKDGSWYRWEDLNMNGLYNRTLDNTDEIIRRLI